MSAGNVVLWILAVVLFAFLATMGVALAWVVCHAIYRAALYTIAFVLLLRYG